MCLCDLGKRSNVSEQNRRMLLQCSRFTFESALQITEFGF